MDIGWASVGNGDAADLHERVCAVLQQQRPRLLEQVTRILMDHECSVSLLISEAQTPFMDCGEGLTHERKTNAPLSEETKQGPSREDSAAPMDWYPKPESAWVPRQTMSDMTEDRSIFSRDRAKNKFGRNLGGSCIRRGTIARTQSALTKESAGSGPSRVPISSLRPRLRKLIADTKFDLFIFFMISTNAALVGVAANYRAEKPTHDETVFAAMDSIYTILFAMELLLRLYAERSEFFMRPHRWWNLFDCVVVGTSVLDALANLVCGSTGHRCWGPDANGTHLRMLTSLRLVRMLRSIRLLRLLRFLVPLRTLILSIVSTMQSLGWAMLLLLMIMYGFGVAFTEASGEYYLSTVIATGKLPENPSIDKHWGSLWLAMYSLFLSITGGISWNEVVSPLESISGLSVALFMFFIMFSFFAVLNVITGVFCQSAIDKAQSDRETGAIQIMANEKMYVEAFSNLFRTMDADHSGTLTLGEFQEYLEDPTCRQYLEALGIDDNDPCTLFKILDHDGQGRITLTDFIHSCTYLRGSAKAIHLAKIERRSRALQQIVEKSFRVTNEAIERMSAQHCSLFAMVAKVVAQQGASYDGVSTTV